MNEGILVIDDEPSVHEVVCAYLERDGFIVSLPHSCRAVHEIGAGPSQPLHGGCRDSVTKETATMSITTLIFIGLIVWMVWMHARPGGCGGHGSHSHSGGERNGH